MKNVQISQELFMKLLRYHLLDDRLDPRCEKRIGAENGHYGGT